MENNILQMLPKYQHNYMYTPLLHLLKKPKWRDEVLNSYIAYRNFLHLCRYIN